MGGNHKIGLTGVMGLAGKLALAGVVARWMGAPVTAGLGSEGAAAFACGGITLLSAAAVFGADGAFGEAGTGCFAFTDSAVRVGSGPLPLGGVAEAGFAGAGEAATFGCIVFETAGDWIEDGAGLAEAADLADGAAGVADATLS